MTSPSFFRPNDGRTWPRGQDQKLDFAGGPPGRRSAGARGSFHVSEMAQQQPRRKRSNQLTRALEPQSAGSNRLRKRHGAGPDTRDRRGVGADDEVDLEAGILETDVGSLAREDEPACLEPAAARRESPKLEANDDAVRWKLRKVDPPAHVPHQEHQVEILGIELRRAPALAPFTQPLEHVAELFGGAGGPVLASAALAERLALDDARVLELAKTLGEQRARDHRHALTDLVESACAGEQLTQDQRRPSLGKGLARHRDRAELSIAFHGRDFRRRRQARQVHFLFLAGDRNLAIVWPSRTSGGERQ